MSKPELMLGLKRGVARRCPNCGEGRLFDGYLKVKTTCEVCGNPNGLYRTDDAAPYFTILVVGHLVIAPMLTLHVYRTWPVEWLLGVMVPLVGVITLALLPFVKGAVLGVLWSLSEVARAKTPTESPIP